ncbi:hypothetical protein CXG81DRAFT_19054 [Caulochytrium protostelioides]|uniref:Uncharacterized protein n=1 Tax=Caulochytrium protostelioides TaxID=1555241 RepID=A0A4P9X7A8_9FUNG|nr:hypothetical protein CXG81DRAFT_19054 [Caulochytrium protostelioides]|eukprot:RKP01098.1 hypothetical protein CXG81DRAFT_19054 [Caulochytrium protostelioides]
MVYAVLSRRLLRCGLFGVILVVLLIGVPVVVDIGDHRTGHPDDPVSSTDVAADAAAIAEWRAAAQAAVSAARNATQPAWQPTPGLDAERARRERDRQRQVPICLVATWDFSDNVFQLGRAPNYFPAFLDSIGRQRPDHVRLLLLYRASRWPLVPADPFRGLRRPSWARRQLTFIRIRASWAAWAVARLCPRLGPGGTPLSSEACAAFEDTLARLGPSVALRLRPFLGLLLHDWLDGTCAGWAWTDLDTVYGDLATWLPRTSVLLQRAQVLTFSGGDYHNLYTRGQFTYHNLLADPVPGPASPASGALAVNDGSLASAVAQPATRDVNRLFEHCALLWPLASYIDKEWILDEGCYARGVLASRTSFAQVPWQLGNQLSSSLFGDVGLPPADMLLAWGPKLLSCRAPEGLGFHGAAHIIRIGDWRLSDARSERLAYCEQQLKQLVARGFPRRAAPDRLAEHLAAAPRVNLTDLTTSAPPNAAAPLALADVAPIQWSAARNQCTWWVSDAFRTCFEFRADAQWRSQPQHTYVAWRDLVDRAPPAASDPRPPASSSSPQTASGRPEDDVVNQVWYGTFPMPEGVAGGLPEGLLEIAQFHAQDWKTARGLRSHCATGWVPGDVAQGVTVYGTHHGRIIDLNALCGGSARAAAATANDAAGGA